MKTLNEKAKKRQKKKTVVKVTISDSGNFYGLIIDTYDDGILLAYIDDFHHDGYIYIAGKKIDTMCRASSHHIYKQTLYTLGTLSDDTGSEYTGNSSISDILFSKSNRLVIISIGKKDKRYFGKILGTIEGGLQILEFSDKGKRSKKPKNINWTKINFIRRDTEYLNVYEKYICK